jgi:hypothetical protein
MGCHHSLIVGNRAISLKWVVYNAKKDEHGRVIENKAWLIAKEYVQKQGVDFEEVFTPVGRIELMRAIPAVAAHEGWGMHHMDVKSMFLNDDVEEEVFVR